MVSGVRGFGGAVVLHLLLMDARAVLRLEGHDGGWVLAGEVAARFGLVNEYLAHLLDRNYSPATVRAYGYVGMTTPFGPTVLV